MRDTAINGLDRCGNGASWFIALRKSRAKPPPKHRKFQIPLFNLNLNLNLNQRNPRTALV